MAAVSFAVDVSDNQPGHQPWASFGVHMGIAKASEGQHSRDPWFARHIADIKAAGLIPGGYHFAWPNQSAAVEAANYIAAASTAAAADPLFVHVLDLEAYPDGAKNYVGASSAEIRAYAAAWVAAVRKAFPGQKIGIYTSGADIAAGHLPGTQDFLWYPAYPVQGRSFAQAAAALRPAPSGHTVWGWQFTSVPRDQTVIYMPPAALRTWAGGTTETAQEDDVPLTTAEKQEIAKLAAAAVWEYQTDNPRETGTQYEPAKALLWWAGADAHTAAATITAQSAAIEALAAKVGSGVDTAAVVQAVQDAIAAAVVRVDVSVGDTTPKEN